MPESKAARRARSRRASTRAVRRTALAPEPEPDDSSPSRYIERVDLRTRRGLPGAIDPEDLLVSAHRDHHPVQVTAEYVAGRVVGLTGREDAVADALRLVNTVGEGVAKLAGGLLGSPGLERQARRLMGVAPRSVRFRFRETTHLSEREVKARVERLQREAAARLRARGRNPRLHVLLTGATGFLGKEILAQAADDRRIEQVVAVVRKETIRDHKTKVVLRVLTAAERGALLLKRLHVTGARARKFRFVEGDIERPGLGIPPAELARLQRTITHVVHCAASVSFDDTYLNSYRANVLGARNALLFSLAMQEAEGSAFVNHIAIETSYIHGRKTRSMALESELVFPRRFYNNFYELTKAMASIETDRALIESGLRVAQLLPSIVIGDARTGNNRGDTKVVNAPINAFGRAKEAIDAPTGGVLGRVRSRAIAAVASSFPGHPSAELNLVPVDRVAAGILAALTAPESIGVRIHLATDNRIRSSEIVRITREELGVNVRLADPTLFRNFTLPVVKSALTRMGEPKLANALEKLGTIFGGYGEYGQPVHEIGNDVRILGLPLRRPDTMQAFRMLCRHNRYVQQFGRVRDADLIARRERAWERAIDAIELRTGHQVGMLDAGAFRLAIAEELDLDTLEPRA